MRSLERFSRFFFCQTIQRWGTLNSVNFTTDGGRSSTYQAAYCQRAAWLLYQLQERLQTAQAPDRMWTGIFFSWLKPETTPWILPPTVISTAFAARDVLYSCNPSLVSRCVDSFEAIEDDFRKSGRTTRSLVSRRLRSFVANFYPFDHFRPTAVSICFRPVGIFWISNGRLLEPRQSMPGTLAVLMWSACRKHTVFMHLGCKDLCADHAALRLACLFRLLVPQTSQVHSLSLTSLGLRRSFDPGWCHLAWWWWWQVTWTKWSHHMLRELVPKALAIPLDHWFASGHVSLALALWYPSALGLALISSTRPCNAGLGSQLLEHHRPIAAIGSVTHCSCAWPWRICERRVRLHNNMSQGNPYYVSMLYLHDFTCILYLYSLYTYAHAWRGDGRGIDCDKDKVQ